MKGVCDMIGVLLIEFVCVLMVTIEGIISVLLICWFKFFGRSCERFCCDGWVFC